MALNFETLFALGSAGYGTSQIGEIVTAINAINAAGPCYQTYYDVFSATARRVAALAGEELAPGTGQCPQWPRQSHCYQLCGG